MHASARRHAPITRRPVPTARPHLRVVAPGTRRPGMRKAARRRLVRLALLLCVTLVALFGAPKLVQTLTPDQAVPLLEHRVARGESLWQIAVQYRPESDPRQVISQIKRLNDVGDTLQVGQRLMVPAPQQP